MRFLRTSSTRTLLATIAGVIAAIAGCTAIAVAASGSGPVPRKEPLAKAIHNALSAKPINGIYARIQFTNHLIDSSNILGSDPILQGASGRLWVAGHRLRLELQAGNGDAQIVVNNGAFWIYDPSANTVYEGTLPKSIGGARDKSAKPAKPAKADALPSIAQIQSDLNKLMGHVNLSGAIPGDIAGRPEYTVKISPKHDGGLLGAVQLAWDSVHGLPLRFAVYAAGNSSPVLELKATNISYGPMSSSDFAAAPPAGAKVVKISSASLSGKSKHTAADLRRLRVPAAGKQKPVDGAAAVARHVNFTLVAPSSIVSIPRRSVSLLSMGGKPAALITYGQNLGGIVVIEQKADTTAAPSTSSSSNSADRHRGLSLPTVSINGVTAQELDTALGTVMRFTRNGVSYIVLGSVEPVAAEAAARAL